MDYQTNPLLFTGLITVIMQLTTYAIAVYFQFDTITDFSGG
jgi:hypothetical protein